MGDARVRDAFARIRRWAKTQALDLGLRDAYTGDVPAPIAALYRTHDGQDGVPILDIYMFLPAEEAAETKRNMDETAEDEAWWSPHWFPFADDRNGQYLVVDQRTGAVLEYIHDDPDRPVWANSLGSFLSDVADALESGERAVHTDGPTLVRAARAFDPLDARVLPGRFRSLLGVLAMFLGARGPAAALIALVAVGSLLELDASRRVRRVFQEVQV